jgi:hypothetical protein
MSRPFRVELDAPEGAAELLARCDGRRTVAELGHADFIRECIASGLLEVECEEG